MPCIAWRWCILIGTLQFNCLYRWHATTSQEHEQWTEKVIGGLLQGKSVDEVTSDDFRKAALAFSASLPKPQYWPVGE